MKVICPIALKRTCVYFKIVETVMRKKFINDGFCRVLRNNRKESERKRMRTRERKRENEREQERECERM